jgi:acetyltransferase-like isoleucine patch superfamily enzyme
MRERAPIIGEQVTIGADVRIDPGSVVCAREIVVGRGASIGPGVRISADRIEIGDHCRIGPDVSIVSPDVRIGAGSTIGEGARVELNEYLRIGTLCDIGRRLRIVGQGVNAGDQVWLTDDITIGGGGARGPRAYLTIGHRSAMMDRCFVNIAEPVKIGDEVAFSNNVIVLTHSMWQPVLDGGTATFAPVRIGSHVILYVNAVIAPGVTVGDHATVAAAALVLRDVPSGTIAIGNPARIMKAASGVPSRLPDVRRDAIVHDLLREYAAALGVKGASVQAESADTLAVSLNGSREIIRYLASSSLEHVGEPPTITLAHGPAAPAARAAVHFDLAARTLVGDPTPLAEDLRDFLRRRSIRIFTERPFQSLPPANLARLKAALPAGS